MKIGVISDTHGDMLSIQRALRVLPNMDTWIHLGDFTEDAETLKTVSGVPVYSVRGNCDAYSARVPYERTVTLCNTRLLLVHGHQYDVNTDTFRLSLRAQELNCQCALYGHTHISMLENDGHVLLLNPGSPHRPLGGRRPSVALLTLTEEDFSAGIVVL